MKFWLPLFALLLASCARPQRPSEDYVLIEFASKLEEDYQKLDSSSNAELKKDTIFSEE